MMNVFLQGMLDKASSPPMPTEEIIRLPLTKIRRTQTKKADVIEE
jgi:hypothetical protein